MRFKRFQMILMFLCLAALGLSIGFLSAGVPTTAPFWFLVTLVSLVLTLIPRNFWVGLYRKSVSLGATVGVGARHVVHRVTPHARGWFRNTLDAIGSGAKSFGGWIWNKISTSPLLWFGILFTGVACLVFASAYATNNWRQAHVGLFLAFLALGFFMSHFDQWDNLGRFIARHPVGMWLTASVTCLAITSGHNWGFYPVSLCVVSTILATIAFFGWSEKVKKKVGDGFTFVWDRFIKLLTGGYGFGATFLTLSVIALITVAPTVMKNNNLSQQLADWVFSLAVLCVIFLIPGIILGGEKIFKIKKKK